MKTIIAVITMIIIIAIIILIIAITSQRPVITEVTIFRDITDQQLAQPNADEILSLYNFENKWNGSIFRFSDVTNVSYNQATEITLEARNKWLADELNRDREIKNFKNSVSGIITKNEEETIGKDNSSVYFPIATELNRLSQSNSTKKIMLIYSDLMENTDEMSFYNKQKFDLLKTNPESVSNYFAAQVPLASLQGINIYIIFQPNGMAEDEQFKVVSGFYKNLLESKGATVEIAASIN